MSMLTTRFSWLTAFRFAVLLCIAWPRASLAGTISIQFETFHEEAPDSLCVVGAFVHVRDEKAATPDLGPQSLFGAEGVAQRVSYSREQRELRLSDAPVSPWFPSISVPRGSDWATFRPRYICKLNNFSAGTGSFAVLHVKDAIVSKVQLSQTLATLEVQPENGRQDRPVQIELIGGTYLNQVTLSVLLTADNQRIDIPLVPRWVQRRLTRGEFHCSRPQQPAPGASNITRSEEAGCKATDDQYCISLRKDPPDRISLKDCDHEFSHVRRDRVPSDPIRLNPTQFWFNWEHHCLAPPGKCPIVYWPSSDVRCDQEGKGPNANQCRYMCTGPAEFPAKGVRLGFTSTAGTPPTWTEEISYPGITVRGYLAPEERRVVLNWDWPTSPRLARLKPEQRERRKGELRDVRATLPGDELEYLELKTPEGRVHRVHFRTTQIRVPELDCGDYLSYRYVGARSFEEEDAEVLPSTGILLKDPDSLHKTLVNIGFTGGAGVRYSPRLHKYSLGPQAEAALFLVFRVADFKLLARLVEPEMRIGATFAGQPYCSLASTDRTTNCAAGDWQSINYWRVFAEPGLRQYTSAKWSWGLGTGAAYGVFFSSSDAPLVTQHVLWTGHISLGYEIVHGVALDLQGRAYYGEQYNQTIFNQTGVVRSGAITNASRWSLFPGLMLRLDDLL
jgi:hypothetical protein